MIVYADRKQRVDTASAWPALLRRGRLSPILCELGAWESAWLDAAGLEYESGWDQAMRNEARRALQGGDFLEPEGASMPSSLELSTPEGFAFYGLFPQTYAEAARRFHREQRPESVTVIGIRSIGTTLSAVVAAALEQCGSRVERFTVRPTGHPFDRCVEIRSQLLPEDWFAVVDEGPGISGSSFASVCRALTERGAAARRIVLFPSWDADVESLRSGSGRDCFRKHRRYVPGEHRPSWLDGSTDLSAGHWREPMACWPAVQPQHERRKYLLAGGHTLAKFAGLGVWGERVAALAAELGDRGFSPRVQGLRDGFLLYEWIDGEPLRQVDPSFWRWTQRYLNFRASLPPCGETNAEELEFLIETNLSEAGLPVPRLGSFRQNATHSALPVDGRMLPHEWLRTPAGFVKTDSADHHCDHFVPGPQPIEWDQAALSVEFDGGPASPPFWRLAYASCRLGYVTLAGESLGWNSEEGSRFHTLARRYRRVIEEMSE